MVYHWIGYLLLLLAALGAAVWSGREVFLLVPAFFLLLPVLSGAMLLLARGRVTLRLRADADPEGLVWLRYAVENRAPWPVSRVTWRVIVRRSTGGDAQDWRAACPLGRRGERTRALCLRGARTGYLRVETGEAALWDALGLFRLRCVPPAGEEVMIAPRLARVHLCRAEARLGLSDSLLYSQHRAGQDVSELFALHEYRSGDDLRRVHWKLSSKLDQMMVREFGLPVGQPVTVLLESRLPAGEEGDGLSACFDAAASLGAELLRQEIAYDLVWLEGDGARLHIREIEDWSALEEALPELLHACGHTGGTSALGRWLTDPRRRRCRVLYYVAVEADAGGLDVLCAGGGPELHLALAGGSETGGKTGAFVTRLDGSETEFTI